MITKSDIEYLARELPKSYRSQIPVEGWLGLRPVGEWHFAWLTILAWIEALRILGSDFVWRMRSVLADYARKHRGNTL